MGSTNLMRRPVQKFIIKAHSFAMIWSCIHTGVRFPKRGKIKLQYSAIKIWEQNTERNKIYLKPGKILNNIIVDIINYMYIQIVVLNHHPKEI